MHHLELFLALVALCVLLAAIAQRLHLPMAVMLVLGGSALAFVPGLPPIRLDAELALALFLPPLLQMSAYRTDWPEFKSNLRPILLLAIGAVFFTAATVAVVAHWLIPELPWWAAVALGAIVAPPDAVSAGSVLKQFRLPRRLVTVLEGESLVNDASSLVLYRFAVGAVAAASVSYAHGLLEFFGTALGGALIGWLVGHAAIRIFARLDDTMLDIAVSLLAGFAAYIAAETAHASGVLAAVGCGLVLGRKQHAAFTARTRLDLHAVWNFVEFLLASLVFMLIGLQLHGIVGRLGDYSFVRLAALAGAVSATLIASRFAWVYVTAWLPRALSAELRKRDPLPPWTHQAVVSWAGMRGVVSLAAALALPESFPFRDVIVFLAFAAIFATLVLQGTTLGWVVRRLDVVEPEAEAREPAEARARAQIAEASLDAVKAHLGDAAAPTEKAAAGEIVDEYEAKAGRLGEEAHDPQDKVDERDAEHRLRLVAIEAGRKKLNDHTDAVDIETHRALARELDFEEQRIRSIRLGDDDKAVTEDP